MGGERQAELMGRGTDRQEQGELSNLWVVWGWRPGAKFELEVTDLLEKDCGQTSHLLPTSLGELKP